MTGARPLDIIAETWVDLGHVRVRCQRSACGVVQARFDFEGPEGRVDYFNLFSSAELRAQLDRLACALERMEGQANAAG
jgi:hypothetical protein